MRKLIGILFLILTIFFLYPVTLGIFHIGMVWPSILLLIGSVICLKPQWYRKVPATIRKVFQVSVSLGLLYIMILFFLMGKAAVNATAPDDATVVVLGCQVTDDKPSLMLQNRIDLAFFYLTTHPESVCIATGGMDDFEVMTEGECICRELVARGIDRKRIYIEDASYSTFENLRNSLSIIEGQQLSKHVVVATDRFHQYRAHYFALRQGLIPYALSCSSPSFLAPGYWCREAVAITAMFVRGY